MLLKSGFSIALWIFISFFFVNISHAQDDLFISLNSDEVALQTGQTYDIQIQVENAVDLWLATTVISYDPQLIHVMGTISGSPVTVGPFMSSAPTLVVRNRAAEGTLEYTVSRLGLMVEPVSGTGNIGTFRIYPIAPGTTQLLFADANLARMTTDESGERRTVNQPFTPILLELNITGDPVPIPDEATPTPAPTTTQILAVPDSTAEASPTDEPLINVTRAPEMPVEAEAPAATSTSPLLLVAVGLVFAALLGLIILFVIYRRSQRKS